MASLAVLRRHFTVQEYHQMYDLGILAHDERVELIAGEIIQMSPIGRRHAACVKYLNNLFTRKFGDRILIGVQDPISLDNASEPQPDVSLLKRKADYYESGHPRPEDIFLIVEVADSTVNFDREVKIPLYARNYIQEVWLVNLEEHCIEIYRTPNGDMYTDVQILRSGQSINILAFPDLEMLIEEILH